MKLTETLQVKRSNELSKLCHLAKNLYNLANWYYRQDFFILRSCLSYYDLDFILKDKDTYRALPSQTSQQVLKLVIRNWKSYFKALREYKVNPIKFRAKPKIPNYKKKHGESIVIFTNQQCRIKKGWLYFPKSANISPIKTRISNRIKEVRIVPLGVCYKIELVYEKEETDLKLSKSNIVCVDLGLNNLITAVNNKGLKPFVVKGKVVKSINQYYNKQLAHYRSVERLKGNFSDTKRIQKLRLTRNNKIRDIFHKLSRALVEYSKENDIGTIVIGYNEGWKQNVNLGKKTNQNFVQVPFSTLVQKIKYKATLVGITILLQEESYTSKCSFLDREPIEKRDSYEGKRISRGLFRSSNGTIINADINASYNIMRKAVPNSIVDDGIEGVGLHPLLVAI